jgi:Fe2+ transport system protein B
MMGAGLLTGIILMAGAGGDNPEDEALVALGLFGVGFYTALASLPFFIAASVNKNKASRLVLQIEPLTVPTANGLSQQTIPAVSLKIPINTRSK